MRKLLAMLLAVGLYVGQLQAQTRTISGKVTARTEVQSPTLHHYQKEFSGTTTQSDGTWSIQFQPMQGYSSFLL